MKLVAISDLHANLPQNVPEGDVLIIAGDITFNGRQDYEVQANFINGKFNKWTNKQLETFKEVILVAGNHDTVFEIMPGLINLDSRIHYLEDSSVEIEGIKFWGTPWTIPFCDWGFNANDTKRDIVFNLIPENTDVLISHGPPKAGILGWNMGNKDCGDYILGRHIRRVNPKYCFCGHIHEGSGLDAKIADCEIYNVSYVDYRYNILEDAFKVVEI
jgi:Icc-related predicted phosphoesterase